MAPDDTPVAAPWATSPAAPAPSWQPAASPGVEASVAAACCSLSTPSLDTSATGFGRSALGGTRGAGDSCDVGHSRRLRSRVQPSWPAAVWCGGGGGFVVFLTTQAWLRLRVQMHLIGPCPCGHGSSKKTALPTDGQCLPTASTAHTNSCRSSRPAKSERAQPAKCGICVRPPAPKSMSRMYSATCSTKTSSTVRCNCLPEAPKRLHRDGNLLDCA